MRNDDARPPEVRAGEPLGHREQERLVELLAVALERFLRARPKPLTSSKDLCLYDRRADDDAADGE